MTNEDNNNEAIDVNPVGLYAVVVLIIASIQTILPILLGAPINSVLGVVLVGLGFGILKHKRWAAILLVVIAAINACVLALGGAYGSTVMTVVLLACGLKSFTSMRSSRTANESGITADNHEVKDSRDDLDASRVEPEEEGRSGMGKTQKRILAVVAGFIAMAVVIALGASPNQGGLLGAAIIFVFWGLSGGTKKED